MQFVIRKVKQGATAKQIVTQVPNWGVSGNPVGESRILLLMQVANVIENPAVMKMWVQDQREHEAGGEVTSAQRPLFSEDMMRSLAFKRLPDPYKVLDNTIYVRCSLCTLCCGSSRS